MAQPTTPTQDESVRQYWTLYKQLDAILEQFPGDYEPPEADVVRDKMDYWWHALGEDGMAKLRAMFVAEAEGKDAT